MKNRKKFLIPLIPLTIISLILVGYLYPKIPSQIPSHWNSNGQVDGYQPKVFIWLIALSPFLIGVAFTYVPEMDPRKENYEKNKTAYSVLTIGITTVFYLAFLLVLFSSIGFKLNAGFFIGPLVGFLFVFLGNFTPQIRFNYMFGIRTPWTLANENVWHRTHRFAGYVFVTVGFIIILRIIMMAIFNVNQVILNVLTTVIILVGLFLVILYSYLCFLDEKKGLFSKRIKH
jgi:uncharacterized membrane protein